MYLKTEIDEFRVSEKGHREIYYTLQMENIQRSKNEKQEKHEKTHKKF